MTVVRISDIIIERYRPVFGDQTHTHKILTSGRAGTKSSEAAIEAVFRIVSDDDAAAVVIRKNHNKLRKTVYKEIQRAIGRLGLKESDFRMKVSPMEITYKSNGNTIYFTGSDNIDDTKGMIDEKKPIKLVVIDEVSEFFTAGEGEDELQNIEATFIRGNDDFFQILYMFNPPKNPNAPVMDWLRRMEARPDAVHVHTDYTDVPAEWLGRKLIESARILEEADPRAYRWLWLGECIGVDDLIYYMFDPEKHIRAPGESYTMIAIGVDYGQQNATTFQAFGIGGESLDGLGEYYYSGRDAGRQRSPGDYARDFVAFTDRLAKEYGCRQFYTYIDPSAQGLAEEIKRAAGGKTYTVVLKNAENAVALGISRVQKLLTFGALRLSAEQRNAIREFGRYEYDQKSIEAGTEKPVKEDDHCMDAIRYAVMGTWKKARHYLPAAVRQTEPEGVIR